MGFSLSKIGKKLGGGLGLSKLKPSKLLGIDHRKAQAREAAEKEAAAEREMQEARAAAEAQAAETLRQQKEYQQTLLNIQRESAALNATNSAEMSNDMSTNVVAGGSADLADNDALIKRRKTGQGTGMAAQLGINV